jgi:hypothetical protein
MYPKACSSGTTGIGNTDGFITEKPIANVGCSCFVEMVFPKIGGIAASAIGGTPGQKRELG